MGDFALVLIDRFTGDEFLGFDGTETSDCAVCWIYSIMDVLNETGGLWFLVTIVWFIILSVLLKMFMRRLQNLQLDAKSHKVTVNRRYDNVAFTAKFAGKKFAEMGTLVEVVEHKENLSRTKVMWHETDVKKWDGEPPKIIMFVDPLNQFILDIKFVWNGQRQKAHGGEISKKFLDSLEEEGILSKGSDGDLKE